jgi:hypothetical protein
MANNANRRLDQEHTKTELINWMQEFVEKPNSALGDWAPCPYARAARLANKIEIVFCDADALKSTVESQLSTLEDKDVVVVCFDHTEISASDLEAQVKSHNQLLMPRNYVILEDHPDAVEHVNGVHMNFGLCGLLVVQKLNKLNTAADTLRERGYYDQWDQAALDSVVAWRYYK